MSTMDILNLLNRPHDIMTPQWYQDVRNLINQSAEAQPIKEQQREGHRDPNRK